MPAAKPIKVLLLLLALLFSGCSTLGYYSQSVVGHSRLMLARQPLSKAIEQAAQQSDTSLVKQLRNVRLLREFAVTNLDLPDNHSYLSYVALDREYPVWTVVAAMPFSLKAKSWCYPVIGCASYRGYFSQQAAQKYADGLTKDGYEAIVNGATAYSTLGWFNDPILPSMLRYGEANVAQVIFHELAHQQLYIKNNSAFNEAFASVVGEQGSLLWLAQTRPDAIADYKGRLAALNDFSELLSKTKQRLSVLYQSEISQYEMQLKKQSIFDRLVSDYQLLKDKKWNAKGWFDTWFDSPVNNARLAAFSTYREYVPRFEFLLKACNMDFQRFYASLSALKSKQDTAIIPTECVSPS